MGQVSTEQTVAIIDSVARAVRPETPMQAEPNMNFWHLLWLAIIPVVLGWWLNSWRKK